MKSLSARLIAVIAVLSLLGNVLLYLRYSTSRPLVTVGGEVITRKQYQELLERQAGQPVLSKMVFDKMVAQAAAREGVTPTPQDVQARLDDVQRRAPQQLAPFAQDPAKMAELRQDLATTIALENLRIKDVALSPAAVAAYYAGHQADFKLPQQVRTNVVVTQNAVDADTASSLLKRNTPPDAIARQPRLRVAGINGYNPDLTTLAPAVKAQINAFVNAARVGDVKTLRQGPYFLTFQVSASRREALLPLAQVRDQVERAARLERAPPAQEELARLYQAAPPTFNSDKYAAYFDGARKYPLNGAVGKKTASVR